jgi:hypothetical protein
MHRDHHVALDEIEPGLLRRGQRRKAKISRRETVSSCPVLL